MSRSTPGTILCLGGKGRPGLALGEGVGDLLRTGGVLGRPLGGIGGWGRGGAGGLGLAASTSSQRSGGNCAGESGRLEGCNSFGSFALVVGRRLSLHLGNSSSSKSAFAA